MQINIKPQNGDDALAEKRESERARAREREKKRNIPKSNALSMSNAERKRYKSRIVSNI